MLLIVSDSIINCYWQYFGLLLTIWYVFGDNTVGCYWQRYRLLLSIVDYTATTQVSLWLQDNYIRSRVLLEKLRGHRQEIPRILLSFSQRSTACPYSKPDEWIQRPLIPSSNSYFSTFRHLRLGLLSSLFHQDSPPKVPSHVKFLFLLYVPRVRPMSLFCPWSPE
jgi:hypothetical protein